MGFRYVENKELIKDRLQTFIDRSEQENRYYDTHHVFTEPFNKKSCDIPDYVVELCSGVYEVDPSLPKCLVIQ